MVFRAAFLVALISLAPASVHAQASEGFGLHGIGGQLGFVSPEEEIGSTVIFGGHMDLGNPIPTVPELRLVPSISFWSSDNFNEIGINGDLRYVFPTQTQWSFYAGGGFGLYFTSFDVDIINLQGQVIDTESESDTDFGLILLGGAMTPLSSNVDGFGEARFKADGLDTLQLVVGVTVSLDQ